MNAARMKQARDAAYLAAGLLAADEQTESGGKASPAAQIAQWAAANLDLDGVNELIAKLQAVAGEFDPEGGDPIGAARNGVDEQALALAQNRGRVADKRMATDAGSSDSFGRFFPEAARISEVSFHRPSANLIGHPDYPTYDERRR